MKPTKKNPELNAQFVAWFGISREASIQEDRCVICGGEASSFRDKLSEKEFAISGMCQTCQDKVF